MAVSPTAGLTMPTAPAQANARNDRRITITVCVFLTAIIWIVFGQTLTHDFVNFDDDRYVYENSEVNRGLTLDAYLRYARVPSLSRYVTMSILLACGLMSKATFVTVPLVLLLLDYWPLQRASDFHAWRRMIIEKIPLFALSAAASVATMFAQ